MWIHGGSLWARSACRRWEAPGLVVWSARVVSPLEKEIDRLYGLPLGSFIEERGALATRARAEHGRDAAAQIKALPKPSVAASAVNQLYWQRRTPFERMMQAG